ncbi:mycothiol system anti-sigma-R factor [Streptomyces gobiensis]|nr:mycothiol system anti-sigma-R factor [Streptomyces gobiensis]UGY93545.1 mycothiol system anti-sigma-R factor [Streptomyces gobiensis]
MSCGEPHETDCSEVLDHLYEYLDQEMPHIDREKLAEHFDECSPCLEKYGLEQAVKKLVKRCCGHDDVPTDLRSKVMGRIELIRAGETVPDQAVLDTALEPGYTHGAPDTAPTEPADDATGSSPVARKKAL